jgi:hypothetical protein
MAQQTTSPGAPPTRTRRLLACGIASAIQFGVVAAVATRLLGGPPDATPASSTTGRPSHLKRAA